ncbi:MAG: gamma-glutamyltransferase [Akkermansiaceae bacterium]|nr:gamma-glutamyltransferase [Akkermansiaceae bacterium]
MTASDLANYAEASVPLVTTIAVGDVIDFRSSRRVHVAKMLNILENLTSAFRAAARGHLLAETMKLAFADRAHWLGAIRPREKRAD